MKPQTPEMLKEAIFRTISECRVRLSEDQSADISEVEQGVRDYCAALAALPKAEGQRHMRDLEELMDHVTSLGNELVAVRDVMEGELASLGRMKSANIAYQKTDSIGITRKLKKSE